MMAAVAASAAAGVAWCGRGRPQFPPSGFRKQETPGQPGFVRVSLPASRYSAAACGRSTSSTYAIGALSPARKPHFRIRR